MWGMREALRQVGRDRSVWAGIPTPLNDQRLVIEPSWPWAKEFERMGEKPDPEAESKYEGWTIVNQFYSASRRCDIIVARRPDGKSELRWKVAFHAGPQVLQTLGAADAWGMEQEAAAINLLDSMVNERQLKQYILTGSFLESSPRSGLTYVFRRLRPTLALTTRNPKLPGDVALLAALCMHPIGYYAGSWAGAMCPTDDVVAHLALMRGDEAMFWKRCNQHPPYRPEAGL